MALPIEATPTLTGKDAKRFLELISDKSKKPVAKPVDVEAVANNIRKVIRGEVNNAYYGQELTTEAILKSIKEINDCPETYELFRLIKESNQCFPCA